MITSSRKVDLHRGLIRPVLFAGGERRLVLLNVTLIALLLLGVGIHYITVGMAFILATLGHGCLVHAAKSDPIMSEVYLRHIRYDDYYSSASYHRNSNRQ